MTVIDKSFTAEILRSPAKGGWTYVVWPEAASFFGTRGLVKVRGTIDGTGFSTAFMAMGGGVHKLPLTRALLADIGKDVGDTVSIRLLERLG